MTSAFFAVCCTANLPNQTLNEFLSLTYANSRKLDGQPCLILITSLDLLKEGPTGPTEPPVDDFTSPFLDMDLDSIRQQLNTHVTYDKVINTRIFAVLDEQSISDLTALLVQYMDSKIETARAHFDSVNNAVICLDVAVIDIIDVQDRAREEEDGVFRSVPPVKTEQKRTAAEVPKRITGRRYFETEDGDTVMLLGTGEGQKFEDTQMFSKGKFKKIVRELPNSETRL